MSRRDGVRVERLPLDQAAPSPPREIHHVFFRTRRLEAMRHFYRLVLGAETFDLGWISFVSFDQAHHRLALFRRPGGRALGAMAPATRRSFLANARRRARSARYRARAVRAFLRNLTNQGLDHVAYEYEELDQLLATFLRLKAAGVEPYWTVHHGPTISFYYADPDGNGAELQWDEFQGDRERFARVRGQDFLLDPIGVDVEPERLVAARRAGLSPARVAERAYRGELRRF
jgi:catechol-2,3-dioxygenase